MRSTIILACLASLIVAPALAETAFPPSGSPLSIPGTGGFWSNSSPRARFSNVNDRLMVGAATAYSSTGLRFPASASDCGPAIAAYGGGCYLITDAVFAAESPNAGTAVSGLVHSNVAGISVGVPIALSGFALNDATAAPVPAWSGYLEASRVTGSGSVFGLEIATKNKGTDSTSPTPYARMGSRSTIGTWYAGGGDTAYGGTAAVPSGAAIVIGKNTSTWDSGIVFQADGITGCDGTSSTVCQAISLGVGNALRWSNSAGTSTGRIYFSDSDASSGWSTLILQSARTVLTFNNGGTPALPPLNGNYFQIVASTGKGSGVLADTYASATLYSGRRANGTNAAPSALALDDLVGGIAAYGYGATAYTTTSRGNFTFNAAEAWTDSAQGMYAQIQVTPTGSTTKITALKISAGGGITLNSGLATSGTAKGTLCIDTSNVVYIKTTTGACL